ncbi:MAG: hypothetical protein QOH14_2349, partial [Pseudonocardiales bacterium]|nr:hypothetical protein [Pseudonocardiales bacterium]
FAADGTATAGSTFAKKTLPGTYTDAYARVGFLVKSQGAQVTLLRLRDTPTGNGGYLYLTSAGKLAFRSDALAAGTVSAVAPGAGWHSIELHLSVNGPSSSVEVWLDGAAVSDLTFPAIDLGTAPIGVLQIGETAATGSWDVVFDDAAFGTSRIGTGGDTTAPSTPAGLAATTPSPFEVDLSWAPSTDDVGVAGYDVFRDGTLLAGVGAAASSYADATVLAASTHDYTVRARDGSGNVSALSGAITATTPAASSPVFADGFETGDLSAWTTKAGLVAQGTDVRSGSFAAEGTTAAGNTFAKKTLPATYTDAYARVGFLVKSQGAQVTLLRLRDTPTGNGGYLYLTAAGKLAFRSDALTTGSVSAVGPGAGWHVLELHLRVSGVSSSVDTWLDGAAVSDLTFPAIDLGTAPMGVLQIGETAATGSWDIVFDDAAFGTSRIGTGGDTTAPSTPAGLAATTPSPFEVDLSWAPSTDDVGVAGYDVFRDGSLLAPVGAAATSYADTTVLAGSSHDYAVRARDGSGNVSLLSGAVTATTPGSATPIFADGFETDDLSAWTTKAGLLAEGTDVRSGAFGAEGTATAGNTFAKKTLPATYADAYARVGFLAKSQAAQVTLLRLRDTPTGNGGYLYLTAAGKLAFRSDALAAGSVSAVGPGAGWHVLELHLNVNGTSSSVQVWLDGAAVSDLTFPAIELGTAPIGVLQIGETAATGSWDIVFDDAAFGTSRIGTGGDTTAPSTPAGLAATTPSPFEVDLTWSASTDNVGVTGYDVFRDGSLLAPVGPAATSYADTTVLASSTHQYAVRARDGSGNVSPLSAAIPATTPAAGAPIFADGFESGDLSAWTTKAGLAAQGTDVRSGSFAAEGTTTAGNTFAKKTMPATYADAYARVGFLVKSQGAQVTLLRMRDTPTGNGGYVYLTSAGKLAFRSDALTTGSVSTAAPGPGWHALELHLNVNGTNSSVQVWLDGVAVSDLTFPAIDLGTAPIGVLQIGETAATGSWDIAFDDAAFGTSRLGPTGDTVAPSTPSAFTAVAASAFEADLGWGASTDDGGVVGYEVFRDGALLVSLGATATGYADTTVLAGSSHDYAVRARDASGNRSPLTGTVTVVTPGADPAVFADGFESGNLSAWTSSGGLVVQGTDVHSGSVAAEGNTSVGATYAKKTLPSTYDDGYARVAFLVKSQTSQLNLLRLRAADGTSIGFVYLDTSHRLGFRNDVTAANTISTTVPGAGWHVVELHLSVTAGRVDVWLDGAAVPALA